VSVFSRSERKRWRSASVWSRVCSTLISIWPNRWRTVYASTRGPGQQTLRSRPRRVNPQQYYKHVTPGVRGTDPLGTMDGGALGMLASRLLGSLTGSDRTDLDQLRQRVPGLHMGDPQRISPRRAPAWRTTLRQHHREATVEPVDDLQEYLCARGTSGRRFRSGSGTPRTLVGAQSNKQCHGSKRSGRSPGSSRNTVG
jgi:hypothetical protein